MKKLFLALFLLAVTCFGQTVSQGDQGGPQILVGTSVPGSCSVNQIYIQNGTGSGLYWCNPSTHLFVGPLAAGNNSGIVLGANGGTGVANTGFTITLAGNLVTTGAFNTTFAQGGTTTVTLPTTSSTMARTDAGQTFTGVQVFTAPSLTNPVVVGPAGVNCGATCSPTSGMLSFFNVNSGSTATLPTSSGSGNVIRFRTTITQTSATIKVLLTTVTDVIIGAAIGENAGTAKVFYGNAITAHSLQMPFAGTQPSGGFAGDYVTCTDIATGTWACDVVYQAGTTPTTPYSTSTT